MPHGPVDAQSAPTHISTSDTPTGGALHSSRKTAELAQFQISYYLDALEDTCLLSSLRVLKKVHDKFFDGLESIHDTKVRITPIQLLLIVLRNLIIPLGNPRKNTTIGVKGMPHTIYACISSHFRSVESANMEIFRTVWCQMLQ